MDGVGIHFSSRIHAGYVRNFMALLGFTVCECFIVTFATSDLSFEDG